LESDEVGHEEGHVDEEDYNDDRPGLLETGVRVQIEIELICFTVCTLFNQPAPLLP
jgi:hypothetical protein